MAIESATPSPPLGDALLGAAAAWLGMQSGLSLDRALQAPAPGAPAARPGVEAHDPALAGAVRDLASTAVRRRAQLDHLLGVLSHRPPDAPVRALLAVALAQLLARAYADFTLVDQAVDAARRWPLTASAGGFVNAVLRAFLRRRAELEEQACADPARRWNVPPWWLRRVREDCGEQADAVLAAELEEPPLVLRVNVRRTTVAAQQARLSAAGLAARRVGAAALWLERALPVERIPGFADGCVSVQDAGAQLAAGWLGVAPGMRVLDACAAPGGKTAHLLEIADCRVDAVERDGLRAQRIGENLRRLGLPAAATATARIAVADVLQPAGYWDGQPYDRILLDAPCTASGVVRRHPDIPWSRRPEDVANLATQQAKMLRVLWPLLAPAGRLLYVVCSVFAAEGRSLVAGFVRRQPGARLVGLAASPGPAQAGAAAGLLLLPNSVAAVTPAREAFSAATLPLLHDGFFYALIEKN